jgi:hypothetical protein
MGGIANGDASVYDRPSRSRSDYQIGLATVSFVSTAKCQSYDEPSCKLFAKV